MAEVKQNRAERRKAIRKLTKLHSLLSSYARGTLNPRALMGPYNSTHFEFRKIVHEGKIEQTLREIESVFDRDRIAYKPSGV